MFASLKSEPLAGEYLTATAINLADAGDFDNANKLFRAALLSRVVDKTKTTLFLFRYLVAAGHGGEAEQILDELLCSDPKNEAAQRLHRRLFPSIMAINLDGVPSTYDFASAYSDLWH